MNPSDSRVVIVGGGFAGLFAARALRRAPVQVILIDRAEHHLFQPMLYQCATGILSEGKIATPLRDLLKRHRNVEFELAEATGIDPAAKRVMARRVLGEPLEFAYDYLILAAGMRQSYFGHDEYAAFAPGMKTLEDAMRIRRRVFGAFEMAESATDPAERKRWLTFALVGGGPTGVELAGQIREVATKTLRRGYRHIKPEDARVMLFDGGSAPRWRRSARNCPRWPPATWANWGSSCIWARSSPKRTSTASRSRTTTATSPGMRWAPSCGPPASQAPPLAEAVAKATGAKTDRAGRLLCGKDLSLPGHPEIMVTGDLMCLDKLPGVAEVAMQTGLYAGRRIGHEARGQAYDKPFRYHDLGSAAYISRGRAVVSAFKLHFGGFLGWWVWLFIHIGFLTGYRNRLGAILGWWFAFARDLRRERSFTVDDLPVATGAYGRLQAPGSPADTSRKDPAHITP